MTVADFKKWLDERLPDDKYGDYAIEYIDFHNQPGEWKGPDSDGLYIDDKHKSVNIT